MALSPVDAQPFDNGVFLRKFRVLEKNPAISLRGPREVCFRPKTKGAAIGRPFA